MKSTNIWTIIVIILVCINSVILVIIWKQKRPGQPAGNQSEVKDFLVKQLSLTKGQVEKFENLRQAHHTTVENLNEKIRLLKDSLFKNLNNPGVDTKIIDTLSNKIGYNTALIDKTTFYHFKELRATLGPAQQKKFDEIIGQALQMLDRPMPPNGAGPGRMPGPDDGRRGGMPPPPDGAQPNDDRNPAGQPPQRMPPGPQPGN